MKWFHAAVVALTAALFWMRRAYSTNKTSYRDLKRLDHRKVASYSCGDCSQPPSRPHRPGCALANCAIYTTEKHCIPPKYKRDPDIEIDNENIEIFKPWEDDY